MHARQKQSGDGAGALTNFERERMHCFAITEPKAVVPVRGSDAISTCLRTSWIFYRIEHLNLNNVIYINICFANL